MERCEICGGVTTCPGDPPPNVVPYDEIDEAVDVAVFPFDSPIPEGWTVTHRKKYGIIARRPREGYAIEFVGSNQSWRLRAHGWPKPVWVGQCTYMVVYRLLEG